MTRPESFEPGKTREVEVIAWYPAAAASAGKTEPDMRDGMEEVLSFTRLAKLGGPTTASPRSRPTR